MVDIYIEFSIAFSENCTSADCLGNDALYIVTHRKEESRGSIELAEKIESSRGHLNI